MKSRSLGREVRTSQHVGVQDLEGAAGARREVHLRPHHRHRRHRHGARHRRSAVRDTRGVNHISQYWERLLIAHLIVRDLLYQ